ncbi:WAT1-related protein At1g09380-like isoform X1 [Mangifera indica]|uniref:WAT1-related protein At1g09380-like isoform X1 n=1 Tax=Mangifera indica TaxID=29780 RepID=UPI001CFC0ED2|nr:WAT1-related protein At1g09380-like isoform X1 [Mangifera indica]
MLSDFLPFLFMVSVQFGYAGMDITAKLALEAGMKPLVLVTYRQIFATFVMLPVAYFLEWKTRPKITKFIVFQILLCSLTGATGNQVLYFVGLAYSTPTIGCALTNILPAVTFVLAVVFRQEFVGIKTRAGQAKVLGTVLCVGGAMLLSFYNGEMIPIPNSGIHWGYANRMSTQNASTNSNLVLGSILLMASTVSWAAWIVIQTQMSKKFPAPYISTTLMCFLGSIECGLTGLISEHKLSAWSLSSPIRLISAIYAGFVCSALAFSLTSWSIQKKGPLYVSVFNPLPLIIVAILSWALLGEKLFLGTAIGSVLIVIGLYAVLWGKDKEIKLDKPIKGAEAKTKKVNSVDVEMQPDAWGNAANRGT